MQELKLANDLFLGVFNGTKKATVRAGTRDVRLGPLMLSAPDGRLELVVEVTQVKHTTLEKLSDADAQLDGAATAAELKQALLRFYPNLKDADPITVIYFKQGED